MWKGNALLLAFCRIPLSHSPRPNILLLPPISPHNNTHSPTSGCPVRGDQCLKRTSRAPPLRRFLKTLIAAAANPVAPLFSLYSSAPNAHTMSALDRPIFYAVTFINEVAAASSGTAAAAAAALKTGDWRILLDTRYGVYAASIAATVVWPFLRAAFTACVSDVSRG